MKERELLRAECVARRDYARAEYAAAMDDTRISADERAEHWEAEGNFFARLAKVLGEEPTAP